MPESRGVILGDDNEGLFYFLSSLSEGGWVQMARSKLRSGTGENSTEKEYAPIKGLNLLASADDHLGIQNPPRKRAVTVL